MTSSCKDLEPWNYDKSLQNYPHYIRIIKYPYIPKANNNDRNFNKIISPSANKTNFKTVTMTNKNLIPIAKEYSFQTQNTTRLGVPIPRGPNFNTSQYGLTSSHNMRIRNNSTIEKELIRKKLRAVREREKKLLEYQVYSSRIFQKTSSCDRYINNDSKYLDQFCNNSRVCSVGKSIEKKKVDRIFIKNEINCISNNKRKNTNKNIFQSKNESGVPSSNKHDNNLKTNNVIGKGNYTNLKPAKLTESKKNKLIPSAKNTVVSTNTNDKDNSQTLSKLPAKKELRSIYCKNILIYNSKKESFGTKSM